MADSRIETANTSLYLLDPLVPFFIKFPKSMGAPRQYTELVSTMVLAELTMLLVRGQLHRVEEAAAWIKSRHIVIESDKLLGKSVDFRKFEPLGRL